MDLRRGCFTELLQGPHSQSIAVLLPSKPFIVRYVAGVIKSINVTISLMRLAWFDLWWWRRLELDWGLI